MFHAHRWRKWCRSRCAWIQFSSFDKWSVQNLQRRPICRLYVAPMGLPIFSPYGALLIHSAMLHTCRSYGAIFISPCSMLLAPCSMLYAPCSLLHSPCSILLAPCSLLPAPCSLLLAPCSLPYSLSFASRLMEIHNWHNNLLAAALPFRNGDRQYCFY